ncbi:uncharacterized protein DNG_08707 [Cephalotrichum gorgonifer]|uniref:Peptidase A1 domain-containing protein n=1 Tax=Cephalotrichum gorgonifer TaxID=2041049 RepID=A0AAE8N628_9PEZI|nr:uncharacterized protein DNG_08707 [Cephalotrichum gorgonifer]
MRLRCLAALLLASLTTVHARAEPRALIGEEWHGIDGNWSTTQLWVGNVDVSEATMNLIISTSLSETWVVGSGGCVNHEQLCPKYRGGTLDIQSSATWHSLGDWQLSFPYTDVQANGNYGLDTLVIRDSRTNTLVALDSALIGAYNTTEYYNGFFGLGIVSGEFGEQISDSPFSQMVAKYGWFPSYTYGYTAGAYYKGSGTPSSLVLGGYDQKRFEPHNTEFTLTRDTALPQALVRGIEISAPEGNTPGGWDSDTIVLSGMNESFKALIDSSTPYLWLPDIVCERFASALNLTLNQTLDAYVMHPDQFDALKADESFSFTFSLSSYDNNDDLGHPLDVPGVVNITISAHAFAHVLQYPYNSIAIRYGEPAVPYMPIKRASGNNFILGRTFLQETYLLTKYDSTVFSVHQARFPEDRLDTDIVEVRQPRNSAYPPPASDNDGKGHLTKSQMIGIVAGAVVASLSALFIFFFCCRRHRKKARMAKMFPDEDTKETASSIIPETPKTPVARIFSKIIRRRRSKKTESAEASGTEVNPAEVGADATHEVYEMPVPPSPVELDADTHSIISETELGTGGDSNVSSYEAARRKMERRLQGPVPAYSPRSTDDVEPVGDGPHGENKSMQDVSPVDTYRPTNQVSPTSSPTYANTDSLPPSLPSPLSPRTVEWTSNPRSGDIPSPMTIPPSFPSMSYRSGTGPPASVSSKSHASEPSSLSRSSSSAAPSPTSATSTSHSGAFQRTPIDPSRIICLGPLPENIQIPRPGSPSRVALPRASNPELKSPGLMTNSEARVSTETLGSNFTDMEEQMARGRSGSDRDGERDYSVSPSPTGENNNNLASPQSRERIDAGAELVHVPQLAEKRYSWEED